MISGNYCLNKHILFLCSFNDELNSLFSISHLTYMKKQFLFLGFLFFCFNVFGQKDSSNNSSRVIIIPYQSMMYFSDADNDIAHFSKNNERNVRNEMRNDVEANVYHQLLAKFDAISLMRATSLNGEEDLNRIYGATRYTVYSKQMKQELAKEKGIEEKSSVKKFMEKFSRKEKDQTFWVSDSSVMLGMIGDREVFKNLFQKYNEKYILFISQFEINTSNKNTIEWMKQKYSREFTMHYNLFDKSGNLLRAETLTVKGGNENSVKEINDKYIIVLANKLKEILTLTDR